VHDEPRPRGRQRCGRCREQCVARERGAGADLGGRTGPDEAAAGVPGLGEQPPPGVDTTCRAVGGRCRPEGSSVQRLVGQPPDAGPAEHLAGPELSYEVLLLGNGQRDGQPRVRAREAGRDGHRLGRSLCRDRVETPCVPGKTTRHGAAAVAADRPGPVRRGDVDRRRRRHACAVHDPVDDAFRRRTWRPARSRGARGEDEHQGKGATHVPQLVRWSAGRVPHRRRRPTAAGRHGRAGRRSAPRSAPLPSRGSTRGRRG
jgi:hypothetical protein